MPKPVSRHVMDTRAANKIMNILEGESAGTKKRIIDFVISSIAEQAAGPDANGHATLDASKQPSLPLTEKQAQ